MHRTSIRRFVLALLATAAAPIAAAGPAADSGLRALELGVPDVERAVAFYTAALGFSVVDAEPAGTWTLLANGDARLALSRSGLPQAAAGRARAYPNFSVGDLAAAAEALVGAGGRVGEAFDSPVGRALRYVDPFGHPGHLIDHPWDEMSAEAPPAVFNVAASVRDVETSERFYTALGFAVRTRDYLPQTLVFEPRGTAQLILHPAAEGDAGPGTESGALLLDFDPARALAALEAVAAGVERTTPATGGATTVEVRDPSGILVKLARRPPAAATATAQLSVEQAAAAFERLKRLAGQWQATSTKGWSETVLFEVAARGSVVVETSRFADAPQNTMFTMFHLDAGRLLATHYCEAGNQPRLVASAVSHDGRELTFTFLDGTGLPSRDHGHMDQAVFRFLDADRFTSRWTWYQKGSEQWLEEIEHRRLATAGPDPESRPEAGDPRPPARAASSP